MAAYSTHSIQAKTLRDVFLRSRKPKYKEIEMLRNKGLLPSELVTPFLYFNRTLAF